MVGAASVKCQRVRSRVRRRQKSAGNVREAILEHLDDLEDLYAAERTVERIRSGDERTIPLEDALKRHGVED